MILAGCIAITAGLGYLTLLAARREERLPVRIRVERDRRPGSDRSGEPRL